MTLGRPGALLADRYRLDRLVGDNGSASAERWQAYDERLARRVTARLTSAPEDPAHEEAAQAVLASMARLNHPAVAAVYDVGTTDDLGGGGVVGYAISEWTDGRTLSQIMDTGPQPWQRVAGWGRQICGALAALHSIGIVHGALGPNSIAIHDDRQVKILDAGLVSLIDGGPAGEAGDAGGSGGDGASRGASERSGEPADESDGVDESDEAAESDESGELDESDEGADVPAGAADDIYALGLLLWEAVVGAAPDFAERDEAREDVARGDLAQDDGAENEVEQGGGDGARDGRELDLQPLRQARVPAELVELLVEMLDADPVERPTAVVAQRRFGPFAGSERSGNTLPEIPVATAGTRVNVPTPQVGPSQPTGVTQRVGPAGMGSAEAALATERERRRGRGLLIGIALLIAAIGTSVGLLVANLSPSNAGSPVVSDTAVPSPISPGAVMLSTLSLTPSQSPSQSPTPVIEPPPARHTPSKSPSPTASSASPSASPTHSASVSASASGSSSATPSTSASSVPPSSSVSASPPKQ